MNMRKWILLLNDINHPFRRKSLVPGDSSIQHNLPAVIAETGKPGYLNRDPSLGVQARPRIPTTGSDDVEFANSKRTFTTSERLNTIYQPEQMLLVSFSRLGNTRSLWREAPAQHLVRPRERIDSFRLKPALPRIEFRSSLDSSPFLAMIMARPVPNHLAAKWNTHKLRLDPRLKRTQG